MDTFDTADIKGSLKVNGTLICTHKGGKATCEAEGVCDICKTGYIEKMPHIPNADDGDCTTEITCSTCDAVTTEAKETHKDTDNNGKCDACGKDMPAGISTVAIVSIAAGSAVICGIGIFALIWFVIKKKTFTDLIKIFKR